MDIEGIIASVFSIAKDFISNNWALVSGILVGYLFFRVLKTSLNIFLLLIFAGVVISILTNMGILPPLSEMWEAVKALVAI